MVTGTVYFLIYLNVKISPHQNENRRDSIASGQGLLRRKQKEKWLQKKSNMVAVININNDHILQILPLIEFGKRYPYVPDSCLAK